MVVVVLLMLLLSLDPSLYVLLARAVQPKNQKSKHQNSNPKKRNDLMCFFAHFRAHASFVLCKYFFFVVVVK